MDGQSLRQVLVGKQEIDCFLEQAIKSDPLGGFWRFRCKVVLRFGSLLKIHCNRSLVRNVERQRHLNETILDGVSRFSVEKRLTCSIVFEV